MKKSILTFVFLMSISFGFSQKMFQSTTEVGTKLYIPSAEFKQKVSNISKIPIEKEGEEYPTGISNKSFYQLSNGFISLYQDEQWSHFRMIFDKKLNWVETHVLYHADVQRDEEYYQFIPKVNTQMESKKYSLLDFPVYIKVTNKKGFWYELKGVSKTNEKDIQVFVFDKDLKLVKMRKVAE